MIPKRVASFSASLLAAIALWGCSDSPNEPSSTSLLIAQVDTASIKLIYECGNTFRVRNPNPVEVTVTYAVTPGGATVTHVIPQLADSGTVTLPARSDTLPYSETIFVTKASGTVRLLHSGTVIEVNSGGTTPCQKTLRVRLGRGVSGVPTTGDSTFAAGATAVYAFTLQRGYKNLLVVLDGQYVPATGTVTMDADHLLLVGADTTVEVPSADQPLVASVRAILTAEDPAAAYQAHLNRVTAFFDQVGEAEAERRIAAVNHTAIDPGQDGAAIRRVSLALANRVFTVTEAAASQQSLRSRVGSSTEAGNDPATIVFVNGVFKDQTSVISDLNDLRSITREANLAGASYRVVHYYNRTFTDPVETMAQRRARCLTDLANAWRFLSELSLPQRWGQCLADGMSYTLQNFDLTESARQFLELTTDLPIGTEPDARALADFIQELRVAGRQVIVVPHSQGNLLTQQAINILRATERDPAKGFCVAATPLAAPTAENWMLAPDRIFPVQVQRDIILLTPSTHFLAIATDSSERAGMEIDEYESDGRFVAPWHRIAWGLKLHTLAQSYFPAPQSRETLTNGLGLIYRDCAVGSIAIGPTGRTIPIGATLALESTVKNRNERELPGRKLVWASSNPSAASVDSTGLVTAASPGVSVTVSAAAGGVSGRAVVHVIEAESPLPTPAPGTPPVVSVNVGAPSVVQSETEDLRWTQRNVTAAARSAPGTSIINLENCFGLSGFDPNFMECRGATTALQCDYRSDNSYIQATINARPQFYPPCSNYDGRVVTRARDSAGLEGTAWARL